MLGIDDFPFNQDNAGGKKQTPTVKILNKKHRGEHHKMSPIVNTAVDAAFILHNKCLEWAENQNADVITLEVEHGQHQQIFHADNIKQIK